MFDDVSVTTVPPTGAGPLIVTVPVDVPTPVTVVGFSVTPVSAGALTVRFPDDDVPFRAPDTAAVTFVPTLIVVAVKVADVCPAAIETDAGTETAALLDARITVTPPVGAAPFNVIVPVDALPPVTLAGLKAMDATFGAVIPSDPLTVVPNNVAESETDVFVTTGVVDAVNVAVV